MLLTVFNFKKLIYLEKELAVQLRSNTTFSNKNLKLWQTDTHNGICQDISSFFFFFFCYADSTHSITSWI